jgi:hypothetical protein
MQEEVVSRLARVDRVLASWLRTWVSRRRLPNSRLVWACPEFSVWLERWKAGLPFCSYRTLRKKGVVFRCFRAGWLTLLFRSVSEG